MNGVVPFGFYILKLNTGWAKKKGRGGSARNHYVGINEDRLHWKSWNAN